MKQVSNYTSRGLLAACWQMASLSCLSEVQGFSINRSECLRKCSDIPVHADSRKLVQSVSISQIVSSSLEIVVEAKGLSSATPRYLLLNRAIQQQLLSYSLPGPFCSLVPTHMYWIRCRHYQTPTGFQGCTVILEAACCARLRSSVDERTRSSSAVTSHVGGVEHYTSHLFWICLASDLQQTPT